MPGKLIVRAIGVIMIAAIFGACVTSTMVTVYANDPDGMPVNDATVKLDGEVIGQTPNAQVKISNFVGNYPELTVSKAGYETVKTEVEREVKAPNVVLGIMLNFFAWLFVYGPKPNQEIVLAPLS